MKNGVIITLSGISGAGKSYLIKSVLERYESFEKLKSVTTRKKRIDEKDGIDKFFLSQEEFIKKNDNDEMCVVNNVFGNLYGYYKSDIKKTKKGKNLITELYYKEISKFKEEYPNTISVYVLPADIAKTIDELKKRNASFEETQKRISDIRSEIDFFKNNKTDFDLIITNNYDEKSVEEFINSLLSKIEEVQKRSIREATCKFSERVGTKEKNIVDNFVSNKKDLDIIYTSFDGDDMHYISDICNYEISRGNIPLNPECALGYYVSTVSLCEEKQKVMFDCLTLEMLSNKLSVYKKNSRELSEGILAEMILWDINKENGIEFVGSVDNLNSDLSVETLSKKELNEYLLQKDSILRHELNHNLLNNYLNSTHETVYIMANFENFKHIDWARNYCYKNGKCPISPQNILPYFLYSNKHKEYLESRLELLKRVDKIYLFIDKNNFNEEMQKLDKYTLAEIYFINKYLKNKKIEVIGWDEALVPKYNPNKKWSLTTKEDLEVRNIIKKLTIN